MVLSATTTDANSVAPVSTGASKQPFGRMNLLTSIARHTANALGTMHDFSLRFSIRRTPRTPLSDSREEITHSTQAQKAFIVAPFGLFAAEGAEGPHISLKAEPFTQIGEFTVTNSMVYGAILMILVLIGSRMLAKKSSINPVKGPLAIFEIMVSYVISLLEATFHDRKKAVKFAPVFAVYFIVIMLSNLSGLLPIVGEGITSGGIPALRPFTADLNSVLALSVFSIAMVQILSIKESGIKGHLKHYFSDKPKNPINLFVGVLEVLGELTRIISLSLRLFLNTVIGEILIAVFIDLSGPATPLTLIPIIAFEALVAYIQAYIFTVLSATYLALATHHEDAHDDDHSEDHAASNKIAHSISEPLTHSAAGAE